MVHAVFKCTADGFFADPTDCWVYHICDGGTHSVRACEEDLFFNPKTGLCDWPMNVECKKGVTTKKPLVTTRSPSQRPLVTIRTTPIPSDEVLDPGETMCTNDDYGYMAHPKDCRKYIYCQEGTVKVFNCQGGLLWKQSDGNCVWPLDSDCPTYGKKTTPMPNQPFQINNFPSNNNNNNNNNFANNPQAVALLKENYGSLECPADATGFYPNPYDCSAYHFCSAGKDQVVLCEPGLQYRPDKQVCDWPVNVNCAPKCPNNVDKFRFLDPKSCCRYYECINGRPVIQLCQYPLLFDMNTKQCLDYTKVKCGIRRDCTNACQYFTNEDPSLCEMVPSCSGKPQGVYLDQNRQNCQFFYTCRDNRVFNHTRCSANMRFNQYEGRCMPPNLVTCTSDASGMRLSLFWSSFYFIAFLLAFIY